MPHIIVEENGAHGLDVEELVGALHKVAMAIEALPTGGLRVRSYRPTVSLVADGEADRAFVYITVRLGGGRPADVKRNIGDLLFRALTEWAEPCFAAGKALSLGLEIQEIDPDLTWKKNNIHKMLKDADA
jgi:5-carboxymethyl-2-hydroxymuconate isomerase